MVIRFFVHLVVLSLAGQHSSCLLTGMVFLHLLTYITDEVNLGGLNGLYSDPAFR